MTHTILLSLITFFLGTISALLAACARIFWSILDELRKQVAAHSMEIASLVTWQKDHKDEVIVQRQHFAAVAESIEERVEHLEEDMRRHHPNGPLR